MRTWSRIVLPGFRLPSENLFNEHRLAAMAGRFGRLFALTPLPLPGTCTLCGRRVEVCPRGAISLGSEAARVDLRRCIRCFCCDELCETKAIPLHLLPPGRMLKRIKHGNGGGGGG